MCSVKRPQYCDAELGVEKVDFRGAYSKADVWLRWILWGGSIGYTSGRAVDPTLNGVILADSRDICGKWFESCRSVMSCRDFD